MRHNCELMGDYPDRRCGEISINEDDFRCTRPHGHDGPHVACGTEEGDHELDRWSS